MLDSALLTHEQPDRMALAMRLMTTTQDIVLRKPLETDKLLSLFGHYCNQHWCDTEHVDPPIHQDMQLPSHEVFKELLGLVEAGKIQAITKRAEQLAEDDHLQEFSAQVLDFAREFQMRKLKYWLKQQYHSTQPIDHTHA